MYSLGNAVFKIYRLLKELSLSRTCILLCSARQCRYTRNNLLFRKGLFGVLVEDNNWGFFRPSTNFSLLMVKITF